jgi:CRISPR-associated exonuclease Cas4
MLSAAGMAFLLGCFALLLSRLARNQTGLPHGRPIYRDVAGERTSAKTLFSAQLGLSGKPDYLIQHRHRIIPLEVKSGPSPDRPHTGHVLQLAAYCALVESEFGQRPARGLIRYADGAFEVPYTNALAKHLATTLRKIRSDRTHSPKRSHENAARCRACGYAYACDQALAR